MAWTRQVMTRLGLTLNEAKTSVRDGRKESFDFLGYSFGSQRFRKDGHWYLGASPSRKSVARLKLKVRGLLRPGNQAPWTEVRDCPSSKQMGLLSVFHKGGSGSSLFDPTKTHAVASAMSGRWDV